ncbi:MAG: glycosyltransferase family 9 protein [Pseudomonadota bacterium]
MNIQFQRAVDRFIGVPICFALSLLDYLMRWCAGFFGEGAQPSGDSVVRQNGAVPPRILVILLSEMGSLVLAQPMFAQLKQRYPGALIYVMLFAKNREVLDLLGVIPPEQVLTIDDRSLFGFARDSLNALACLRALKLDAVIDCELFSRVSSIFSYLSAARLRVGFHRYTQEGLYRGSFINRPVLYNPYRHLSLQFLTLLSALESSTYPLAKALPVLWHKNLASDADACAKLTPTATALPEVPQLDFPEAELASIAQRLFADFPMIQGKPLVLVYPSGGLLPIRAWPQASYAELCSGLLADGYAIGLIGMPDDRPLAQALLQQCANPYCIDLTGYTKSVRQLLALFHHAVLLITNDGGPGQFAALTALPSIVFFGPETPQLYRSLSPNAYCFDLNFPCSPCLTAYNHRASPCDGDNQCLQQITPQQVLAKARAMLAAASVLR